MKKWLALAIVLVIVLNSGAYAFAHVLTIIQTTGGTIVTGEAYTAEDGNSTLPCSAIPDSNNGYKFDCWIVDGAERHDLSSSEDFTEWEGRTLSAKFVKDKSSDSSLEIEDQENSNQQKQDNQETLKIEPIVQTKGELKGSLEGTESEATKGESGTEGNSEGSGSGDESANNSTDFPYSIHVLASPSNAGSVVVGEKYIDSVTKNKVQQAKVYSYSGYHFTGWYDNDQGKIVSIKEDEIFDIDRDRNLIAQFEADGNTIINPKPDPGSEGSNPPPKPVASYLIDYEPGLYGREGAAAREWYTPDARVAGQLFTRPGYTQTGWSVVDGGVKRYDLNSKIVLISEITTLYPYWEYVSNPLYLTVRMSGNGSVYLGGSRVYDGWVGKLEPGQSFTFTFYPENNYYVYSILLGGWYRTVQYGNQYTVTYDMMQARNQTMTVRFSSIYDSPKTGDDANVALWIALGGLSAVALGALLFMSKKKK